MLVRTLNALPLSTVDTPVNRQVRALAVTPQGRARLKRYVDRVHELAPSEVTLWLITRLAAAWEEGDAQAAFEAGTEVRAHLGHRLHAALPVLTIKARWEHEQDSARRNAEVEELCRRLLEAVA